MVFNQSQIQDMAVTYFQNILGTEDSMVITMTVEELRALLSYRCPQSGRICC